MGGPPGGESRCWPRSRRPGEDPPLGQARRHHPAVSPGLVSGVLADNFTLDHLQAFTMSSYCDIAPGHPFHGPYHESEYGFPSREDDVLFERLILEINQAGLSWLTILKK